MKQSRTVLVLDYCIGMASRKDHDGWICRYGNFSSHHHERSDVVIQFYFNPGYPQ
ncbi:hypothetical protein [Nitrosomonas sp.]|uniref:hypothetical protein n=1 Tax=Nitrosomonas sp. TaxID=42353 RepID=UPI0026211FEF|nr:hypothetical protein [Nitrosomonas sp.]